jgi:hypothetical protein
MGILLRSKSSKCLVIATSVTVGYVNYTSFRICRYLYCLTLYKILHAYLQCFINYPCHNESQK